MPVCAQRAKSGLKKVQPLSKRKSVLKVVSSNSTAALQWGEHCWICLAGCVHFLTGRMERGNEKSLWRHKWGVKLLRLQISRFGRNTRADNCRKSRVRYTSSMPLSMQFVISHVQNCLGTLSFYNCRHSGHDATHSHNNGKRITGGSCSVTRCCSWCNTMQ